MLYIKEKIVSIDFSPKKYRLYFTPLTNGLFYLKQ